MEKVQNNKIIKLRDVLIVLNFIQGY